MIQPPAKELNKSVVGIMELLVGRNYFENHYLSLCFLLHVPPLLLWYLPPVQTDTK